MTSAPQAPSEAPCEHQWTAGFWHGPQAPSGRHRRSTWRSTRNYACWQGKAPEKEKAHCQTLRQNLFEVHSSFLLRKVPTEVEGSRSICASHDKCRLSSPDDMKRASWFL